ncbi:hypothetical protein [Janthinobacterium agaricidamnosum]|uniref:Plasmid replication/partition related protein n=1 Tax=Janthinobacterium agaricidamnosum NBRC 102515 = DSM 9628 TaxID=1349767 RepID=W0V480_9BURK|nr:hypothetical protein [Janthinobacterium agaricidamnosum]CDG82686.1 putative uncharacterized protein [Janthinobacterium agaricidamnosum NBRC 102515 = DSM 9628]
MNITINQVLQSYIDPLTVSEYSALERSLLAEGCRDALVLWNDVLIDGHNRYAICRKHDIPFKTIQNTSFTSIDDVMLWMIDNHLARRSVSDFQRGVLALRKKEIVAARSAATAGVADQAAAAEPEVQPFATREDVAKVARLSSNQISQIEKIQKAATPELVDAVRSGTISINAAATVASLPQAEQVAAVAGGKKLLQQAAKEIRELRAASRPPKAPKEVPEGAQQTVTATATAAAPTEVERLRAEIAELKQRNSALKAENEELNQRIAALIDAS